MACGTGVVTAAGVALAAAVAGAGADEGLAEGELPGDGVADGDMVTVAVAVAVAVASRVPPMAMKGVCDSGSDPPEHAPKLPAKTVATAGRTKWKRRTF